jgi:hypothetical protein
LEQKIQSFNPADKNFSENMRNANLELEKLNTTTGIYKKQMQDASKYTGLFGQSLLEAGKKFAGWLFMGNIIMGVIRSVRFGIDTIIELDQAMVALKKVTNETNEQYERFLRSAIDIGNNLGKMTQDVVRASTEWARLGYSMQDALKLGEESLVLANVGLMDVDQSTKHLISALHGFNMEAKDARIIVDSINEVGKLLPHYIVIYSAYQEYAGKSYLYY